MNGKEYFPPPEDGKRQAKEFAPPPPEFPQNAAPEITAPPAEFSDVSTAPSAQKKSRILRRSLYAAASAALLFLGSTTLRIPAATQPEPSVETVAEPSESTEAPAPTETTAPPTESEEPPLPVYATYPLGDGNCVITVYHDVFDPENNWENRVLLQQTVSERDFTELTLPAAEPVEGFEAVGYALHYGNPGDEGYDGTADLDGYARMVSNPLTAEELTWVPVSSDGVRYVNIHVLWRYTGQQEYALPLVLDDGMGNQTQYDASTPLASGGCTYLSAYPVPEREGYVFTGWYDENGERVDYIYALVFYPVLYDENGEFMDYDWRNPKTVTLYAGWHSA